MSSEFFPCSSMIFKKYDIKSVWAHISSYYDSAYRLSCRHQTPHVQGSSADGPSIGGKGALLSFLSRESYMITSQYCYPLLWIFYHYS